MKRKVLGESVILRPESAGEQILPQLLGDSPTPEFAAIMAEEYKRLLGILGSEDLRALAVAKMEGYKNEEIAEKLDCSLRTVERQLHLIRL